jgi:HEPN domain-containing protein
MKAATRDWIRKTEHDYLAAVDLSLRRVRPLHDMVCFHCQQSAEKYLKASLEEASIHFPKTHDLESLLALLLPLAPLWAAHPPSRSDD